MDHTVTPPDLNAQLDKLGASALRIAGQRNALRAALRSQREYIELWRADIAGGIAPTTGSLDGAEMAILAALKGVE